MTTVSELPLVTKAERQQILDAPRTSEAHRELLNALPAMNAVQVGGQPGREVLPKQNSIVAWNVERCLFPEETAAHLTDLAPTVVLLSEVDHGMSRTAQRHPTEVIAAQCGMTYAYGVEFHELGLGGPSERHFCKDDFNERGWHGNAILSAAPFEKVTMVRLDDHGHWFTAEHNVDPKQPRVGGRMALAAVVPTEGGPLCVVSTHLESNAPEAHRATQFDLLLNAVETFAPDMPIVIGGDLNTGNYMPPDFDWQQETLFRRAEARGYDWSCTADGPTTRASLITPHPTRQMKLDWFCTKGLTCQSKQVLTSVSVEGTPLSDHDAVHCDVVRA